LEKGRGKGRRAERRGRQVWGREQGVLRREKGRPVVNAVKRVEWEAE
jgi:hypothetical protein